MGLLGKRPKEKYHSYKGEVGKIADNIIDPKAWSSENIQGHKTSQKLTQLKTTARNDWERAGYINEMIVAETLIHAIKTQYPDMDFKVSVTNRGETDFSIFFDSSEQMPESTSNMCL